jgi:hypothetical protein
MTSPAVPQTPQELYALYMSELSASGSTPLLDNDGTAFTLRGAIGRILWKVNYLLGLLNRPLAPTQSDDLYGHVLSMRAEHLITQAILTDLAARLGSDVKTLRANTIASFDVSAS